MIAERFGTLDHPRESLPPRWLILIRMVYGAEQSLDKIDGRHGAPRIRGLDDRVRYFRQAGLGRPVGVAAAKDGSLFGIEDSNGTVWRVNHQKVASNN